MIKILNNNDGYPLKMPWSNCIAVGRAYELLREDLLNHLRKVQKDIGYNYCRFHAVFDDDMAVVIRKKDGGIMYQWHHIDKVYDALLDMGLRPFVELNPMPKELASGKQTMFAYKMNITPPKDYKEWYDLIHAFVNHIVDRYGIDEIRKWYFEVWNEPNLSGFWSGSKEEYFKLYDASAFAIKSIDPLLKVGGPASSKANWIEDIINHCVSNKVPIDFVSTHLYPQDEYVVYEDRVGSPHKSGEFFANTFKEVNKIVKASALPRLEIHWTEWNTQCTNTTEGITWSENIYIDNQFAASFIVKNCLELDNQCDTMCYWIASDIFGEGGIPGSVFSNTYGLMTIHGIPKAAYNAFMFLKDMKGSLCKTGKSNF